MKNLLKYCVILAVIPGISVSIAQEQAITSEILIDKSDVNANHKPLSGQINITVEAGNDDIIVDKKSNDVLFVQENQVQTSTKVLDSFSLAVQVGDVERIDSFLKNGSNPNQELYDGNTLTTLAGLKANSGMLSKALEYNGNFLKQNKDGKNFLHLAVVSQNMVFLDEAKKKIPSDIWNKMISQENKAGRNLLHTSLASLSSGTDIVSFLIANKVSINQQDANKQTPLHYAASTLNWDALELLLKAGGDVSIKDINDRTVDDYILEKMPIMLAPRFFQYLTVDSQKKVVKVIDRIVVGSEEKKVYEIIKE